MRVIHGLYFLVLGAFIGLNRSREAGDVFDALPLAAGVQHEIIVARKCCDISTRSLFSSVPFLVFMRLARRDNSAHPNTVFH